MIKFFGGSEAADLKEPGGGIRLFFVERKLLVEDFSQESYFVLVGCAGGGEPEGELDAFVGVLRSFEEDALAATKMWRKLFGPRFPDLGGGKGAASGPIPVPPPTFPDRPVRPKKPGGFASTLVL